MIKRCLLMVMLLLTLPACAPATLNAPADVPTGPLIDYQRSGGFAGLQDHLVIQVDGSAQLTRKGAERRFSLSQAELEQLTAALEKARFAELREEYLPSTQGADLFDYVVTFRGHRVHTQDTAVPEALRPALNALNEIISRHAQP